IGEPRIVRVPDTNQRKAVVIFIREKQLLDRIGSLIWVPTEHHLRTRGPEGRRHNVERALRNGLRFLDPRPRKPLERFYRSRCVVLKAPENKQAIVRTAYFRFCDAEQMLDA